MHFKMSSANGGHFVLASMCWHKTSHTSLSCASCGTSVHIIRVLHEGLPPRQIQPNLSFGQVQLTTWLSSFKYKYKRKFLYQPRKWLFGQPARKLSVDPWLWRKFSIWNRDLTVWKNMHEYYLSPSIALACHRVVTWNNLLSIRVLLATWPPRTGVRSLLFYDRMTGDPWHLTDQGMDTSVKPETYCLELFLKKFAFPVRLYGNVNFQ